MRFSFFFLVFFCFCQVNLQAQNVNSRYYLASGSKGGNYYKTAKYIAKVYKEDLGLNVIPIASSGSIENIEQIKNSDADFAIVQRDVLLKSIYNEVDGINNIVVITPLFEEKMLIYTQNEKPISFSTLKEILDTTKVKIGFTSKSSYSNKTFRNIAKYTNLNYNNIIEIYGNYNTLIKKFQKKQIDFVVSFSLPIQELEKIPCTNKVFFNKEQIQVFDERFEHIKESTLADTSGMYTFGIWSFLIAKSDVVENINEPNLLFTVLKEHKDSSVIYNQIIKNTITTYKRDESFFKNNLIGIPQLSQLNKEFDKSSRNLIWLILLSVFLLALIFFISYLKLNKLKLKDFATLKWIRYRNIFIAISVVGLLYYASIELFIQSEKDFVNATELSSQFLNLSRKDLHIWVLTRNITGIDNGLYPRSNYGKALLSFSTLLLYIGGGLVGILEYINYKLNDKRKKGKMKIKYKNHIVLIGWTDTTPKFIEEVVLEAAVYNKEDQKIVCIVEDSEKIMENNEKVKELDDKKAIHFVSGECREIKTLKRSNIYYASTVVIMAEDKSKEADEKTLLRALAIARFCREKAEKENNTPLDLEKIKHDTISTSKYKDSKYIIAEVNNKNFKKDLIEADVNEIIISDSYSKNIISQAMFNHGVSKVLDEVLQYDNYNELYIIDLIKNRNKKLVGYTFDELLVLLRKFKILLIGIKVTFHDEDNNLIIDHKIIQNELSNNNLPREIIINPIEENELKYVTDNDDQLIVLAKDKKYLDKQIKSI